MTREEEIHEVAKKWICNSYSDSKIQAFKAGAKYADQHPVYFKGQTDKMQEREIAFVDRWMKEQPTYADAIAWAEKRMIEKSVKWLLEQEEMIGISFTEDFIERFKSMIEE